MVTKLFCRIAALSVAVIPVLFSETVSAVPRNPNFFCFAQGPYGEIVNLNSLCQQTPSLAAKEAPKAGSKAPSATTTAANGNKTQAEKKLIEVKPEARLKVDFSELNYEKAVFVGSVRNKSGKPIDRVLITYKVYERKDNSNWKLVDTGSMRTADITIGPGKTSSFKALTLVDGDKIVITNVQ